MANALYDKGLIDWDTNNIKCALIDTADYTVNLATHDNWDDVPSAARVAISGNLAGKSVTDGVADATDVVLSAVVGDPCEAIIIFADSGTESTSRLIAYIDSATGLPITPNGGDITIVWNNGADKIFKL